MPSVYFCSCYCYMVNKISGPVFFNDLREVNHLYCLIDYVNIGEGKRLTYIIFNLDNSTAHSPVKI